MLRRNMLFTDGKNNIYINTIGMKKIITATFFSALLQIGCKQNTKTNTIVQVQEILPVKDDSQKAIANLKKFYFSVYSSDESNEKVKKNFLSERMQARIDSLTSDGENLSLDYDPFIKGQDYNGDIIKKTLKIKRLSRPNEYRADFLLFGENDEQRTAIDFLLVKSKGGNYLIDGILNDEYLNFKSIHTIKKNNPYTVIKKITVDINQDGKQDTISVFGTNWSKKIESTDCRLFKVIISLSGKDSFTTLENDKIITPYYPDNVASGFSDIKVKNNYFTVEQANSSGGSIERSYITFKYDHIKHGIDLYKYSTIITDRSSGDELERQSEYSEKDFGKIPFENFKNELIKRR